MFVKSVAKMVNKPLVNLLAKSLVNMLAEALVSMLAKTLANMSLHGKPYFLFPDALKRWSFLKNCAGRTWSFLYYRERWYFLFPKIWPYTLDGKWKMIFLKKIHGNIFFRPPEKMVFPKRVVPTHDLSCIIWKDGIFSWKHDLFSPGRKWKTSFPRKYMETWCTAQRRKPINLIYKVEAWLLLKFIWLEIFYNE